MSCVISDEKEVKQKPGDMLDTWLVRGLAPLVDLYVNDAFAAAHRNAPSMVAFQELLPTAGSIRVCQRVALEGLKPEGLKPEGRGQLPVTISFAGSAQNLVPTP